MTREARTAFDAYIEDKLVRHDPALAAYGKPSQILAGSFGAGKLGP